ncbi:MAG: hypothetical protein K1X61_07815 [Chitinophagales bacterium]|nr:hypothetical protein [Chitinophagales bacterium]
MKYIHFSSLALALCCFIAVAFAQSSAPLVVPVNNTEQNSKPDSTQKLQYPNNIKLSLTSNVTFAPSAIFTYERSLREFQTVSLKAGYITFPQLLKTRDPDSINFESGIKRSGYTVGADYRFYFKKENEYAAPHGLYWGPFIDFSSFTNKRSVSFPDTSFATGTLEFTGKLKILQAGINMGYQFVIRDRLTIDMNLFGPALALYGAVLSLDGQFDVNQENEYLQDLYEYLVDNIPVVGELADTGEVDTNGRANLFFAGFRYSVSAGFRF